MLELRRYFEGLMGIEPVRAGEDTRWHLRFNIGWPDWVLLLFCLFAALFVVSIYLREGSVASRRFKLLLAAVRLLAIGMVVLMLSGMEISIDRTGLPYLVFLVDESESMQVRDRTDGGSDSPESAPVVGTDSDARNSTRLARVVEWLSRDDGEALGALTAQHKLRFHAVAAGQRLLGADAYISSDQVPELLRQLEELKPEGTESRLGANLRSVLNDLRGTPPSSVVLITDGVVTAGESLAQAAQYAARKNIPIYAIGVGSSDEVRDLQLHDLLVDDTVFVDDTVNFEVKLVGQGYEGREVAVSLRRKGFDEPLQTRTVRIGADQVPVKVTLSDRPSEEGTVDYIIETPVLERETGKDNNRIARPIRVIDEEIRVLYVEAYPRYEFHYLKSLLERQPAVDLDVVLLDSDPEFVEQDRTAVPFMPTSRQELFDYDVLILGDVAPTLFSQAQLSNIVEFVEKKGGGFLLIAGRNQAPQAYRGTPLEALLPVVVGPAANRNLVVATGESFFPQLTIEGKSSPNFRFSDDEDENDRIWASFPPMYWYARSEKAKPGAQTLVVHPMTREDGAETPLVATQFFGAGRSYYQAFDSTWRWRFRVGDVYHARYWIQTIRFLSRAKLLGKNRAVELLVGRRRFRRGDPVPLRVRFLDETLAPTSDDAVTVQLEHDGLADPPLRLTRVPGRRDVFEGVVARTVDGRYHGRLTAPLIESPPTVDFEIVPPAGELDRVRMNEPELREVAKRTGGVYHSLDQADLLFDELPPGRKVALHTDPPFSLWNTWPVLCTFLALLALEWVLRKRKRML